MIHASVNTKHKINLSSQLWNEAGKIRRREKVDFINPSSEMALIDVEKHKDKVDILT